MEQSQAQHDAQSTGSQSSGSHPSVQPEAIASPAKRGRPVTLRACTECRKKRAKVRRTRIAVRGPCRPVTLLIVTVKGRVGAAKSTGYPSVTAISPSTS